MSLCGEFRHSLDAKNRLFIPAKHREVLGDTVMVVRNLERKCLIVYSMEEWDKYVDSVLSKIPVSRRQDINRFLFRRSLKTGYDTQGRIMLTPELLAHAEMEKGTAVIVGCGYYAEIWNEKNFEEIVAQENAEELNALLRQYDV